MNEHKVREMQMQAASRQFMQALSAGQVRAIDRFGAAIQPGQKILYEAPYALLFEVVDIQPVLDPNVPPGALNITMQTRMTVMVGANQPNMGMIVVKLGEPAAPAPDAAAVPDEEKLYRPEPKLVTE